MFCGQGVDNEARFTYLQPFVLVFVIFYCAFFTCKGIFLLNVNFFVLVCVFLIALFFENFVFYEDLDNLIGSFSCLQKQVV